jgi:hypothetical protein
MAKLPEQLSFARPLIHRTRKIIWKVLGASDTDGIIEEITLFPRSKPIDNRMMGLLERLNILESHINWRLHGLPPRLVNVKLEQAALLAGSGEIEDAIETFKQHCPVPPPLPKFLLKKFSEARSIFMFPGDNNQEWNSIRSHLRSDANITLIDDTSDLFRYEDDNVLVESDRVNVLRLSAIDASARLVNQEFDLIWISSILQRLTPIQAMIILKRSQSALLQGGLCAGMINTLDKEASWPDPRWRHPYNIKELQSLVQYSGLNSVEFQSWGDYELFHSLLV